MLQEKASERKNRVRENSGAKVANLDVIKQNKTAKELITEFNFSAIAMDKSGRIFAYTTVPTCGVRRWATVNKCQTVEIGILFSLEDCRSKDWRYSLFRHPRYLGLTVFKPPKQAKPGGGPTKYRTAKWIGVVGQPGILKHEFQDKWRARYYHKKVTHGLGTFLTIEEAIEAREIFIKNN